jgi:hypothetical protein
MARTVPSLVDDVDVGDGPDTVDEVLGLTEELNPLGRTEAVGRPAKRDELSYVTQLDDFGIRGE